MEATEQNVFGLIQKVGIKLETTDPKHSFSAQRVDSLDLVGLLLAIEEEYGIKIEDFEIPQLASVSLIVDFLKAKKKIEH